MSRCFFIGHREAEEALLPRLKEEAKKLIIEHQVTEFYVGGYGYYDRLAGEAVIDLKRVYPNIRLYRVIPYHPAERRIDPQRALMEPSIQKAWNLFRIERQFLAPTAP